MFSRFDLSSPLQCRLLLTTTAVHGDVVSNNFGPGDDYGWGSAWSIGLASRCMKSRNRFECVTELHIGHDRIAIDLSG